MNANETPWIQSRLEMMHPLAKQMGSSVEVNLDVVIGSFNPVDLRNPNEKDSTGTTDRQSVEKRDRGLQSAGGQLLEVPLTDSCLCSLERSIESLIIEGLEQIIGRRRIEGANRMLLVCGDEDHGWRTFCFQPLEKLKSAEPRQVHVEKQQIRLRSVNRLERVRAGGALSHQLHIRMICQ